MDAAITFSLAKGILDFSVLSTSLSYKEILAIKAAVPSMDLTPYQKQLVIGYEIEANKRLSEKLKRQIAASEEKRREAAIKKASKSSSSWFSKISQKMQDLFGSYNGSYQRVPTFTQEFPIASEQNKEQ